jgi:hypothetical protein
MRRQSVFIDLCSRSNIGSTNSRPQLMSSRESPTDSESAACRPNFTLNPNQIPEFSHNQEGMKRLTAARIGPKHTAHFATHHSSRSSRLDFDELSLEGTLPTNTSVKKVRRQGCRQNLRLFAYRLRSTTATLFTPLQAR